MDFFWNYVAPTLGVILTILAPILGGFAVQIMIKLTTKAGFDIEAKNRDAFQTAITNAAILAASRMGGPLAANSVSQVVLNEAVGMVKASVPDAVAKFNASSDDIEKRVQSQAELILQSAPNAVDNLVETGHSGILTKIKRK